MPPSHELSEPPDQRTLSASYIHFPSAERDPWMLVTWPSPPRASFPPARLQRLAHHLHQLGPRCVYELIRELIAGRDPAVSLEAYADLDPDIVHALGADRFPDLRVLS